MRQWQQATPTQDTDHALKYTAAGPSGPKVSTVPRHPWDSPAAQKLLLERKPVILTGSNFTMFGTEKWTREYLLAHWDKGADSDCYVLASTMKMKSGKPLFYYTDRLPEGKRALTPPLAHMYAERFFGTGLCLRMEEDSRCAGTGHYNLGKFVHKPELVQTDSSSMAKFIRGLKKRAAANLPNGRRMYMQSPLLATHASSSGSKSALKILDMDKVSRT